MTCRFEILVSANERIKSEAECGEEQQQSVTSAVTVHRSNVRQGRAFVSLQNRLKITVTSCDHRTESLLGA